MKTAPIIVIGAGLSGLSAAVRLSNKGYPVAVLEAGGHVGGCCSTQDADGFRFNNGAVYGATPSLLRRAFRLLDMDLDACVAMRPIAVPQVSIMDSGTRVFTTTVEASWVEGDNAAVRTAQYRAELHRLYQAWRPVYRRLVDQVLPYDFSLSRTLMQLWRYLPRLSGSVSGVLEKQFSDIEVRAAVGAITLYTGLAPQKTPATQIVGLLALLDEGFFLPEGGMGSIPQAICRKLESNGVDVRLNARVERIMFRHGRLQGVLLADGSVLAASAVIATNSAVDVVKHMLDPDLVPSPLRRRQQRAPLSHRAISVQLGIERGQSCSVEAFAVNHVPLLDEQYRFHIPAKHAVRWFSYTNPTSVLPGLAPEGCSVVEMFVPVPLGAAAAQLSTEQAWEVAQRYISVLQDQLSGRIICQRMLTPTDYAHKLNLYEGALYGLSPAAKPTDYFPRRTGIPGLYLAGQTTYPGYGVPTAMLSGLHAANAIIKAKESAF